jgi:hypothetical protein
MSTPAPVTHAEAMAIVAPFSEEQILAMARRGRSDPASLTHEEIRIVFAYIWLRETRKMG